MQTQFAPEALADPHIRELEGILRSCVHCGLCTATCPTYVTLGDERDSPRGRIYLIKDLLETGRKIEAEDVAPIDHCLSCNSCMTTCPSGVDYRRLVDHARVKIEETYRRPLADRLMRAALVRLIASRRGFRAALRLAAAGRLLKPALEPPAGDWAEARRDAGARPDVASAARAGGEPPRLSGRPRRRPASAHGAAWRLRRGRSRAPDPRSDDPAPEPRRGRGRHRERRRLLRFARPSHGRRRSGRSPRRAPTSTPGRARSRARAWTRSSSPPRAAARRSRTMATCCATIRLSRRKPRASPRSARDVSEVAGALDLDFKAPRRLAVAYHAACSLQHAQKIVDAPRTLLKRAGFDVRPIPEAHLCCGSAGTYNILQPTKSPRLCATARSPTSPGSSPT